MLARPIQPSPAPAPLPLAVHRALPYAPQTGASLLELLLVGAAGIVIAVGGYMVYRKADTAQQVNREVANVETVARSVVRVYSSRGGYKGMTNQDALAGQVFPSQMIGADGTVRNTWGGTVNVSATPVSVNGAPASDNNGFKIAYTNVGAAACANFAANAGPGFYDVQVGGTSVLNATTHALDMATLTRQCNAAASNEVDFIYGATTNPLGPNSCSASLPPGQSRSQPFNCPGGEVISNAGPYQYQPSGQQTSQRNPYCSGTGTVSWTDWTAWAPTFSCAPICTATSTPESVPAPCPPGEVESSAPYGPTSGTQSRVNTQSCATPIGPLNPPSNPPWTISGQSCAPVCAAPSPTSTTTPTPCPPGEVDSAAPYAPTSGTTTSGINYSCSTPVGPITATPYSTSTPSSCAPICALPTPSTQTQCDTANTYSLPCPVGQSGSNTWQLQETRSASCPAPVGSYVWSAWTDTAAKCNQVNSCAPTCSWGSPPSTTPSCASPSWGNQTGGTWNKTATCNVWSYSGGTCPSCGPAPAPVPRQVSCPSGTGNWTQTHDWTSVAGPTCWTATPWTPPTAPASACPPPPTCSWSDIGPVSSGQEPAGNPVCNAPYPAPPFGSCSTANETVDFEIYAGSGGGYCDVVVERYQCTCS